MRLPWSICTDLKYCQKPWITVPPIRIMREPRLGRALHNPKPGFHMDPTCVLRPQSLKWVSETSQMGSPFHIVSNSLPASAGGASLAPTEHPRPDWLRVKFFNGPNYQELKRLMRTLGLNTVCESARCPNMGECWEHRTATFMILGNICTRACGFCAVPSGKPAAPPDELEPGRVPRR